MINKIIKFSIKNSVTRFAPDPNGFIHLGHIYNIYTNYYVFINKNGLFFLRFDNTNLSNINLYYYYFIIFDLLWLGIKWKKKKFFLNDIFFFFIILCYYLKNKKNFYKQKKIIIRIFFNYLNYKKIIYIFLFKNNFYVKKEFIFIIKKKIIYRQKKKKYHLNIYPTYDFTQSINDYFNKINLSICTKEFIKNSFIYNYLIKKIKNKSFQIEFEKKKIFNNKLSKRKLKNIYIYNIFYLRKLNLTQKKLFYLCNITGISDKISFLKKKNFINSFKIENNYIINDFCFVKIIIFNNKKNLLFNIILNKKNINLKYNIFFLIKTIKTNLIKFNFLILNNLFIINKKILFKKMVFFKKKYLLIKKNNKKNNIKNNHCLYGNKILFLKK